MYFVYAGPVFPQPDNTNRYDVHIYDSEKSLFPVARQIQSADMQEVITFLKDYHQTLHQKEELKVIFKIDIGEPSNSEVSRYRIFGLKFYELGSVTITDRTQSPGRVKLRKSFE